MNSNQVVWCRLINHLSLKNYAKELACFLLEENCYHVLNLMELTGAKRMFLPLKITLCYKHVT